MKIIAAAPLSMAGCSPAIMVCCHDWSRVVTGWSMTTMLPR